MAVATQGFCLFSTGRYSTVQPVLQFHQAYWLAYSGDSQQFWTNPRCCPNPKLLRERDNEIHSQLRKRYNLNQKNCYLVTPSVQQALNPEPATSDIRF